MTKSVPLSVVINTKNSAESLEKTLESVADLAEQIVVMDMNSHDKTRELAKKFTKDVFQTDQDYGYVEPARNQALGKATQPWVLLLDADEELSSGLKKTIRELLTKSHQEIDCFYLPRKNVIFNHEMRGTGWWPDYQVRLFKKGTVTWSDQIHSMPEIHGQTQLLPADPSQAIIHANYQHVDQYLERLNRYTSVEAATSHFTADELTPSNLLKLFSNELFERGIAQNGLEEGVHGVSLALLQGTYQLVVALKKWELLGFPETKETPLVTFAAFKKFQADLNYWLADWQFRHSTGINKFIWKIRRKMKW